LQLTRNPVPVAELAFKKTARQVAFRVANALISIGNSHLPRKSIKVVGPNWVRWVAASMTLEACLLLRAALDD
jgi:hypothetical protein